MLEEVMKKDAFLPKFTAVCLSWYIFFPSIYVFGN